MLRFLQLLRRYFWIPATLLLVISGLKIGQALGPPKPPTIYLHPGGRLTLSEKDGQEITPEYFHTWKSSEFKVPHLILDMPPGTTIGAWNPALNVLGESGFAMFQFRIGEQTFDCHLPYGTAPDRGEGALPAKIIDLRKRKDAPDPTEQNNYDVQVLVDRSTTWDEVFQHTSPHLHSGVSMMIDCGDENAFFRYRGEDARHRPRK